METQRNHKHSQRNTLETILTIMRCCYHRVFCTCYL